MGGDSRCGRCCRGCCRGLGKCCKKTGKFLGIVFLSVLSGFYGCTRRKAVINHVPAILFFHIFPLVFSGLCVGSSFTDYSFLHASTESIPADVINGFKLFLRWSMGVSAVLMAAFALNLSIHLHIVRDEYKKMCLSPITFNIIS